MKKEFVLPFYELCLCSQSFTVLPVSIGWTDLWPCLVGGSAYPLSGWLIKPFPKGTNDPQEIEFNKELSSAHVKVECAIGVIKSCWRILHKRLDSKINFVNKIVIACVVLHNFCLWVGDFWDEPPDDDEDDNDDVVEYEERVRQILMSYVNLL